MAAPGTKYLTAWVVERYTPEGSTEEQSWWTDVGRAYLHEDGQGYTVNLRPQISVSGSLVLTPPRNEEEEIVGELPACHLGGRLSVSVVEHYTPSGSDQERTLWTEIGSAFPHRQKAGFNVSIRSNLAVSGKLVMRLPAAGGKRQAEEQASGDASTRESFR